MNSILLLDKYIRQGITFLLPKRMHDISHNQYACTALLVGAISIILASISPALYDIRIHGIPHTPTYNMTVLLLTPLFLYQWNRLCKAQYPNHVLAFGRSISLILSIIITLYSISHVLDSIGNAILIGTIGNTFAMYILCMHEDNQNTQKI